jgi:hypothetical protein
MKKKVFITASLIGLLISFGASAETDAQVKKLLIDESVNSYSGSCACQYSIT